MSDESNLVYRILPEIHTMKTYGASKEVITVLYYREDAYQAMKEKLVEQQINADAWANLHRKLAEANERIVEFEDIKKGHLEYVKTLKEKLEYALSTIATIKTLASLSNNISRREDCYYIANEALKKIEGMG